MLSFLQSVKTISGQQTISHMFFELGKNFCAAVVSPK